MRTPTSDDPVNPIFCTRPRESACDSASYVVGPSACTVLSTPAGRPPATNSFVSASPRAAAYSAGFHTTALPQSSAGTRYQDGTATGKLPAVTMPATPTGTRKVNSCLSRISDGTVWP